MNGISGDFEDRRVRDLGPLSGRFTLLLNGDYKTKVNTLWEEALLAFTLAELVMELSRSLSRG